MSVIDEIAAERRRQIEKEGWSVEHDDTHRHGEMAAAAACYAAPFQVFRAEQHPGGCGEEPFIFYENGWPWAARWWKPKDRRRDLIRAAALIVAEIERLDRAHHAPDDEARIQEIKQSCEKLERDVADLVRIRKEKLGR